MVFVYVFLFYHTSPEGWKVGGRITQLGHEEPSIVDQLLHIPSKDRICGNILEDLHGYFARSKIYSIEHPFGSSSAPKIACKAGMFQVFLGKLA